ncbi:MAG TPA: polyprenyl synthetase family protein, partial [Spirochaetia bacterium]|nr:polyprenyl synthetase family protein [Spirochaetia bacterium]
MTLEKVFEPLRQDMAAVDVELNALMKRVGTEMDPKRTRLGILSGIVQHPFAVPGKRIRPAIVVLSHRALGADAGGESLVSLAAAVEVLHAASLVHDDVIDQADSRRHQISLNKRFGNRVAVLAGDILYTHFFTLITGLSRVQAETRFALLDIFLDTTKKMCMGEILAQEARKASRSLSFELYKEIAKAKTAVLFSACCRTAGMLADAPEATVECLSNLGLDFGLTFQMIDDVMDKDHGLESGVDLLSKALGHAERARAGINSLPDSKYRTTLHDLLDYV